MCIVHDVSSHMLMARARDNMLLTCPNIAMLEHYYHADYSFEYITIISSLVVFVVITTIIQKTKYGFKVSLAALIILLLDIQL